MKLVVLLDETTDMDLSGCIVLTNNMKFESQSAFQVFYTAFHLYDMKEELKNGINVFFSRLPADRSFMQNNFYRKLMRTPFSVVEQVKGIISNYEINELVLVGGSKKCYYTLMHGESEGNKWWYRSSWLINPILYKTFHHTLKITWLKKQLKIQTKLRFFSRENYFFFRSILAAFINNARKGKRVGADKIVRYLDAEIGLVVSPMPLQIRHLTGLLENVVSERLKFYYLTNHNPELAGRSDVLFLIGIGIKEVFGLLKGIRKNYCGKHAVDFVCDGVVLKFTERELKKILFPDELSVRIATRRYFYTAEYYGITNIRYVVSDMTFGSDLRWLYLSCLQKGYTHYNFQYASMFKMIIPQFELAHHYYMYSQKTYELYRKYSESYHYYMPLKRGRIENDRQDNNTVVVFTQPDWMADRYLQFLNNLTAMIKENRIPITVKIKLHYRQNKIDEFIKISESYDFVELIKEDIGIDHILENCSMMMSMTSTVLFEAFAIGTPGIVIDIDGVDTESIDSNDYAVPEVNFRVSSYGELCTILSDIKLYIHIYNEKRNHYIENSGGMFHIGKVFGNY